MRIIKILVNENVVSKDRDEIQNWLKIALKNHYKFEIKWEEIKGENNEYK